MKGNVFKLDDRFYNELAYNATKNVTLLESSNNRIAELEIANKRLLNIICLLNNKIDKLEASLCMTNPRHIKIAGTIVNDDKTFFDRICNLSTKRDAEMFNKEQNILFNTNVEGKPGNYYIIIDEHRIELNDKLIIGKCGAYKAFDNNNINGNGLPVAPLPVYYPDEAFNENNDLVYGGNKEILYIFSHVHDDSIDSCRFACKLIDTAEAIINNSRGNPTVAANAITARLTLEEVMRIRNGKLSILEYLRFKKRYCDQKVYSMIRRFSKPTYRLDDFLDKALNLNTFLPSDIHVPEQTIITIEK